MPEESRPGAERSTPSYDPNSVQPSFDEYLALREEIALLQARLDQMKPAIVHAVATLGGRLRHGAYEISVRHKVTYDYSDYVAAATAHLRTMKQLEQEKGIATVRHFSEFPHVRTVE